GPAMHLATSSNAPLLRSRRPRPDPGIAPSVERAGAVVPTTKQYLLHHGFPSRSTAGRRLPVHAAGIVRRHGVPLQRLSHHASRRATPLSSIENRGSLICPGRPVSPHARGFLRMTAGSGPWRFL